MSDPPADLTPGVLLAAAIVGLATSTAHAQDAVDEANARYQEGVVLYNVKAYVQAIGKFEEAHELEPDPAYLYNIAQAYRLAGDCEKAASFYRTFLRDAGEGTANRDKARTLAGEMERCATTTSGSATMRSAGVVAAGAGLVAAGTGLYFGWRARDAHDEVLADLAANGGTWTDALEVKEQDAQRDETLGMAFAIGGAAAAVTGGVLYWLGRDRGGRRGRGRAMPVAVTPTRGGATIDWAYDF